MSNIILPLRFSPFLFTWLLLVHGGALLCLQPIDMPLSVRATLIVAITLHFCLSCRKQTRLRHFRRLEWRATSQSWHLSDEQGKQELTLTLRPGCWLTEHFLWLAFFAKEWSGSVSLLFAFDQYSVQELKQLRLAVLNHQQSLKQG